LPTIELCSGTVPHAGLLEIIEIAAQSGFASISLNPQFYEGARTAGASDQDLRARLADAGVRVNYLDGLCSVMPGVPREEHELAHLANFVGRDVRGVFAPTLDDYFRAGEALESRTFNVTHFSGNPDTPRDAMATALSKAAARAQTHGFRFLLEFIPGNGIVPANGMSDLPAALWLIEQVGAPNVGIMLDSRHLARSGAHPEDIQPHLRHVGAMQISDLRWATRDDVNRLMPGEGELPLAELIRMTLAVHPDMPVGVEVLDSRLTELPAEAVAERAARSIRQILASL
jgi:sugar phosphate isomerase/epimerase